MLNKIFKFYNQSASEASSRDFFAKQKTSLFASSKIIDFWDTRNPKDFSVYQMSVTIWEV